MSDDCDELHTFTMMKVRSWIDMVDKFTRDDGVSILSDGKRLTIDRTPLDLNKYKYWSGSGRRALQSL
jgi:hypothetical protein